MSTPKFTEQQSAYLASIASGKRLEDVARENHVAKETVSYQLRSLKNSIGADSLPNLVAEGVRNKVIFSDGAGKYVSKDNYELIKLADVDADGLKYLHLGALEKVPGKQNWIERLPAAMRAAWNRSIIYRAAVHMHKEKGMPVGMAIASAINWAKHICETGDVKQWRGPQEVSPKSRGECCAAVALWESMKAASKSSS